MPRKKVETPAPAKAAKTKGPVPQAPVQELPPPRRPASLEELSRKLDDRSKEIRSAKPRVDGFGKPVKQQEMKAVAFVIMFDNGKIAMAEGDHADTIFRYTQECEAVCTGMGLAYYGGPPAERVTFDDMAERLTNLQTAIEATKTEEAANSPA